MKNSVLVNKKITWYNSEHHWKIYTEDQLKLKAELNKCYDFITKTYTMYVPLKNIHTHG